MSLGFRLSEYISPDGSEELLAVFLQRKGNPHDIVFGSGSGPRLHHAAFGIPECYHFFYVCDLAAEMGFAANVEYGPGRHGPGHALFVYLRDPDGHRVEIYTSDYYTGDPGHPVLRWDVSDPRRRSFYGHAVVPSWYAEASTVLDLDGRPRPVSDQHQILEYSVGADGFPVR